MLAPILNSSKTQAYLLADAVSRLDPSNSESFDQVERYIPDTISDEKSIVYSINLTEISRRFVERITDSLGIPWANQLRPKEVFRDSSPSPDSFSEAIGRALAAKTNEVTDLNEGRILNDKQTERSDLSLKLNPKDPFALFMDVVIATVDKLLKFKVDDIKPRIDRAIVSMLNIAVDIVTEVERSARNGFNQFEQAVKTELKQSYQSINDNLVKRLFEKAKAKQRKDDVDEVVNIIKPATTIEEPFTIEEVHELTGGVS